MDDSAVIIKRFFDCNGKHHLSDTPLAPDRQGNRSLTEYLYSLSLFPKPVSLSRPRNIFRQILGHYGIFSEQPQLTQLQKELTGRKYRFEENRGSFMPFILQSVRNNFCSGIRSMSIRFIPGCCILSVSDGKNRGVIAAGMDGRARRGEFEINGEIYQIGAAADLVTDEDGRPVLKLSLSFLETPHTRDIKFIFYEDQVVARFREIPSAEAATKLLFELLGGSNMGKILGDEIRQQKMANLIARVTSPKVRGKLAP